MDYVHYMMDWVDMNLEAKNGVNLVIGSFLWEQLILNVVSNVDITSRQR